MKARIVLSAVVVSLVLPASAALYSYNFTGLPNGGVIPDGNPSGWADTRTLSGIPDLQITDVNVTLNISGGYNGDLYAYLVHGTGWALLLDRPGLGTGGEPTFTYGFANEGYTDVKLDDEAANGDINTVGGGTSPVASETYKSHGSTITGKGLASFNSLDPNGQWTLFFADLSSGSISTINSWKLDITAVPEPMDAVLGCFAALAGLAVLARRIRRPTMTSGGPVA